MMFFYILGPILLAFLLGPIVWQRRREIAAFLSGKKFEPPPPHRQAKILVVPPAEETAASVARFKAVAAKFALVESALDIMDSIRRPKRKRLH